MLYIFQVLIKTFDSLCRPTHPTQGSTPILTLAPFPTFHARQFPTQGKAFTRAFQKMEAFTTYFTGSLIPSPKDRGSVYFCNITWFHNSPLFKSLHKFFVARAWPK